jgi:hypothetical protein
MGFCVYVYRDSAKRPYYVGSGSLKRPFARAGHPPLPTSHAQIRVKEMPTRQEAYALECLLIKKWGRECDGGLLKNKTLGGPGHRGLSKPRTRPSVRPHEQRAKRGTAKVMAFTVYIYRDENKIPYYVGKGDRYRPYSSHSRNCPMPSDMRQVRVKYFKSEDEALELEALLIAKWGRRSDGGLLMNKSLGGRGPTGCAIYGRRPTAQSREKMSAAKQGWSPSPELRATVSRVHRGRVKSELERQRLSEAHKRSPRARAQRERIRQARIRRVAWLSPAGKVVVAAQKELIVLHPELSQGRLSCVMNGKSSHHKGWRLAPSHTLASAA